MEPLGRAGDRAISALTLGSEGTEDAYGPESRSLKRIGKADQAVIVLPLPVSLPTSFA